MFSYIVPNVTLSLHKVGMVYQVQWERNCGCNGQRPPVFTELVARRDNHILAWHRWKKEQKRDHSRRLRELQRQDDIDAAAFRKATQELETLKRLLEDVQEGPVHDALLNTWSNVFMLWNDGGEAALKHYGKVLSILERN